MNPRRVQRPEGPPAASIASSAEQVGATVDGSEEYSYTNIGDGRNWRDFAYRTLRKLQFAKRFYLLPAFVRTKVKSRTNLLYQTHFNEERRKRGKDYPYERIEIPDVESVTIPSMWLVEYFTASNVESLYRTIRRSGWDGARFLGMGFGATRSLTSSRTGGGQTWWRIAELHSPSTAYHSPDSQTFALPEGVKNASLIGVSIGNGISAVVVRFGLEEQVSRRIDCELRAPRVPKVIRRAGQMAVSQSAKAVLHYEVQSAREEIHSDLRRWVSRNLPGTFSRAKRSQPLFALMFFNVADPFDKEFRSMQSNDALRALGLGSDPAYIASSAQLPGLILENPSFTEWAPEISENVWSIWGNLRSVADLTQGTGHSDVSAAGYFVGETMTDYMARSGLTSFLRLLRSNASETHDNARKLHGGGTSRDLMRLRNRILTTSLDIARLQEDIAVYNDRRWRDREPQFYQDLSPWLRAKEEGEGVKIPKPFDMNKAERVLQRKLARELVSFDGRYRDVLGSVASLGASIDSRRVQRVAILVSLASLGVAYVTLLVAQ